MAEDLDSQTKRVRDLLSSFYGDDSSDETAAARPGLSRRDTLQAINTRAFDAERYMSSLVRRTNLEGLLQRHVEMAAEIKNLDSDMQMLVYENYNKFISATDTIRRMKENVAGMESDMEQLLDKVTVVRSKSDGVNASLFERRERIEELNGTRSLLRKVQFVFDLPKRLRKCLKSEAYSDAVRFYLGALPILKAYGKSSFQACKEESEEVMMAVTKRLQARVMTDSEAVNVRAEAVALLQQLNYSVESMMEQFLAVNVDRLLTALQGVASLPKPFSVEKDSASLEKTGKDSLNPKKRMETLNKEVISNFAQSASTFRAIFPMGEKRLTEAATDLFNKYFESVQKSLQSDVGDPSATGLISVLKVLSTDVGQLDEVFPEAGLPTYARQYAEVAVRHHVTHIFEGLYSRITGILSSGYIPPKGEILEQDKTLQMVLDNAKNAILQGSLDVLWELRHLLDDEVELMVKWRDHYIDLVQGGFQDLFSKLDDKFLSFCMRTRSNSSKQETCTDKLLVPSGFVLLLARLSVFIEQMAVPKITEEVATSFTGGGAGRGFEDRPPFVPAEICRLFRAAGERLLHQYINTQAQKLSMLVKKSVTTPNWLKYKEPRDIRMFVDLLLQEIETIMAEMKQVLDPGTMKAHRRSDSTGSTSSSRSNPVREDRGNHSSRSQHARSRLLERDVAKLFKQKVEIFTKPEYTQASVISAIVKLCLKSFQEYIRLETFSRSGYQQIQLDTHYLKDPLQGIVEDDAVVNFLLDEVCAAAAERCLDPIPLEPAILDKLIQAKKAKILQSRVDS
eukprot:c20645_g1_i1 orf=513-2891(-)